MNVDAASGTIEGIKIISSAINFRKKLAALMTVMEDKNKNIWIGSFINGVFVIPVKDKYKDDAENYFIT